MIPKRFDSIKHLYSKLEWDDIKFLTEEDFLENASFPVSERLLVKVLHRRYITPRIRSQPATTVDANGPPYAVPLDDSSRIPENEKTVITDPEDETLVCNVTSVSFIKRGMLTIAQFTKLLPFKAISRIKRVVMVEKDLTNEDLPDIEAFVERLVEGGARNLVIDISGNRFSGKSEHNPPHIQKCVERILENPFVRFLDMRYTSYCTMSNKPWLDSISNDCLVKLLWMHHGTISHWASSMPDRLEVFPQIIRNHEMNDAKR